MVTCPFCGHSWRPRSENPTITCSQCGRKVRRAAPVVEVLGTITPCTRLYCDGCGKYTAGLTLCDVDGDLAIFCPACLKQN